MQFKGDLIERNHKVTQREKSRFRNDLENYQNELENTRELMAALEARLLAKDSTIDRLAASLQSKVAGYGSHLV